MGRVFGGLTYDEVLTGMGPPFISALPDLCGKFRVPQCNRYAMYFEHSLACERLNLSTCCSILNLNTLIFFFHGVACCPTQLARNTYNIIIDLIPSGIE